MTCEVMHFIVDNDQIGDAASKVDAVTSCLPCAVNLEPLNDDVQAAAVGQNAMRAIGGDTLGSADALGFDGGVIGINREAGASVLNHHAVLQQDGKPGLINHKWGCGVVSAGCENDLVSSGSRGSEVCRGCARVQHRHTRFR